MRTLSDIKNEIVIRLSTDTTIAYYTDLILVNWIAQAHQWASGFKKWPFTEGRISTTFASLVTDEDGYLRGVYPEGWKPDSIRLLMIAGKRVDKKNFYKFQAYIEDNPSSDKRIWSDNGRYFYINPSIDLSGSVTVWGQYQPYLDITDENALTVFTDYADEGNLAIVNEVLSYAHTREKKTQEAIAYHTQAVQLLETLGAEIMKEQYGYQTIDDEGMFKRMSVLDGLMRDDTIKRDQFS